MILFITGLGPDCATDGECPAPFALTVVQSAGARGSQAECGHAAPLVPTARRSRRRLRPEQGSQLCCLTWRTDIHWW